MWTTETRIMSLNGNIKISPGGAPLQALPGVVVDVYRFAQDQFGDLHYSRINTLPAITDDTGNFTFTDLHADVIVQTVTSGVPPYGTVELVQPESLPNLAFYISSQDIAGGTSIEVFDERTIIDEPWMTVHPERLQIALSGSPLIEIVIPDLVPAPTVPDGQFHFLRVGRATRDEIGEIGDAKSGYMNSTTGSFFPGIVDAPFGGTLQIGGHFGPDIAAIGGDLYYSISCWEYGGDPALPFDPTFLTNETQILDPLVNKRYILPTAPDDKGSWEVLPLGPFTGTVPDASSTAQVYKRPDIYNPAVEYYPFYDLMVRWDSCAAPNSLMVLSIKTYRRLSGSLLNPVLAEVSLSDVDNRLLPLMIDNRRPVPVFHPYDLMDTQERKFHTAFATFIGMPETVGPSTPMGICNEMEVSPSDTNGNECILVRYSVTGGDGNPHPHLLSYAIWSEFTPKAIPGAPDARTVTLKHSFSGHNDISASYNPLIPSAPIMEVDNFTSVVVPAEVDQWPPEPHGDVSPQCPQYALEVSLRSAVRTVNGWSRLYGHRHVSRHLIIKRV